MNYNGPISSPSTDPKIFELYAILLIYLSQHAQTSIDSSVSHPNKRISKVSPLAPQAEFGGVRYNKLAWNIQSWISYCRFTRDTLICAAFPLNHFVVIMLLFDNPNSIQYIGYPTSKIIGCKSLSAFYSMRVYHTWSHLLTLHRTKPPGATYVWDTLIGKSDTCICDRGLICGLMYKIAWENYNIDTNFYLIWTY